MLILENFLTLQAIVDRILTAAIRTFVSVPDTCKAGTGNGALLCELMNAKG